MSENTLLGCFGGGNANAHESVCIHTSKILDSCRDKDCVEDLRFYPTQCSQAAIDRAGSIRTGKAELLHVDMDVEPISFNKGYYTIDVRYFYHVTADAYVGAARPVEIHGLAVFDKRVILYGGESAAKVFTSRDGTCLTDDDLVTAAVPKAVVEAVDPVLLGVRLVEICDCGCGCENESTISEVPACIYNCFGSELVFGNECRRVYISLGQFSIIRLERDSQLIMPAYDYCMPTKECPGSGCDGNDPCEIFRQIQFPTEQFFPAGSLAAAQAAAERSNSVMFSCEPPANNCVPCNTCCCTKCNCNPCCCC